MTLGFQVKVEMIPRQRVVYMRRTGAYGIENYVLMETFKSWILEQRGFHEDDVILGAALDNPMVKNPSLCRYDVCLVVSEQECIEDKEIGTRYLDGGNYLVFQIEHTAKAVTKAWEECIPFLYQQGYQLDGTRPILERYEKRKVDNHLCELCFPIV